MNAQKQLHIAIFGLNLRTLNALKAQIQDILAQDIQIHWRSVSEPNLDILLINDVFFETPSIQNLMKTHHFSVLRLISNTDKNSIIEDNVLYLPIVDTTPILHWLTEHSTQQIHQSPKLSSSILQVEHDTSDKHKFLTELLDPMNGKILIFDGRGQIGLADVRGQWFFREPQRRLKSTDYTLNYTYATMSQSLQFAKSTRQDLKFWLWNLLWQSPDFIVLAPENGYFQLKYWPQPEDNADRRDILRMSACFIQGAQISTVSEQLNLPIQRVQQFIAASLGIDFAYPIYAGKAKYLSKNQQKPSEETSAVRKFFGSLRRRLGL